jgi:hypothetical protein
MAAPKLYDYNSSFALARTNPALSGNVKITVDSSGGVWLNSFDADPLLSSDRYKKYNVSGTKSYAEDLFSFFGTDVSPSVIFKVNKSTKGDRISGSNFDEQYDFFYASGAQTLIDKNYPEDFSYFAPLWLRDEIPDFFVIFKVPDPLSYKYAENQTEIVPGVSYKVIKKYGQDDFVIRYGADNNRNPNYYSDGDIFVGDSSNSTYSIISGEGSVCIFDELYNYNNIGDVESYFTDKILPNSQVIKTYDLRESTRIGSYIRSVSSSIGTSFSPVEVNFGSDSYSYFNGISIASGVYTRAGEFLRPYFTSPESTPMIDLEGYITEGFSRNSIVCPNLLNLEFLFDDDTSVNYGINRYFGAYVSKNDLGEFRLNGNFLYDFRNSVNNQNYPKPKRNAYGYYYDNSVYPQSATGGVRIYYEGASGYIPGSNDVNSSESLKLFYITDKNERFYSLKKVEGWTQSLVNEDSFYSYGPYSSTSDTFGLTGSTGATSGTLVLQNEYIDLSNFTGIDKKLASIKGFINGENGRSYVDVEFLKAWDVNTKDLVFKIYWPLGSRTEGAERYDIVRSGDFSATIVWVEGSTYRSGNNYYINASSGSGKDVASAFTKTVYDISEVVWDSGRSESTSIIRVKSPGEGGNSTYYISIFDDYDYFESRYKKIWSASSSYNIGDIVRYENKYYQATAAISYSGTGSNSNPELLLGVSWSLYYSLTSSGYVKIKGSDASSISGVSFFQGGTNKPKIRVAFDDSVTNIVSEGNFIQTEVGFSLIKEVGKYVDSPIYDPDTKLVSGFNNYSIYSVAIIEDENSVISLGSDSRFNVFGPHILRSGVFTFFDFKDFDFDFWSSNYGITPNYETYRYFQLLPGKENTIVDGIEYFIKSGSVDYNGTTYGQFSVFTGVTAASSFSKTPSTTIDPVVFPLQFSDAEYGTYNPNVGYESDLNDFTGFIGIRSVKEIGSPLANATKEQEFDFGLLDLEYNYLEENYTVERASVSRIVPYISKWAYRGGTDSRGNPYRLNVSPAFTPSNFSPTFDNQIPDPKYLTHEWFLLESVPRQFPAEFIKDQQSYLGGPINLDDARDASLDKSLYLSSYFTVLPSDYPADVRDTKDAVKELFSEFVYNETSGFYETIFRGAKVVLKKRSDFALSQTDQDVDTYVSGYRGYEGYRYASLLRVLPEVDSEIQSPVSYQFIENNTQKFILFVIDVVANDYKLQPLGYTGGTGGSPVIDYTLLYSLSDKKYLIETPVTGEPLQVIDDVKLSAALDLSTSSDSLVTNTTNPGIIFIDPNPNYDTDLRDEVNITYDQNSVLSIGYTGAGSFNVPSIGCRYPWPVGVGDTFLEFTNIGRGANYYFTIPFSSSSPVKVPVGPLSIYSGEPVFQVSGGSDYFDFILKRTSFSCVAEKVNLQNPYVSYNSYFYDGETQSTYSKIEDFGISFSEPTLVVKPDESIPIPVYSSQTSNISLSNRIDLRRPIFTSGPLTDSANQVTSYFIANNRRGVQSQLLRYSGKYEPIFRKILYFKNDKTDTITGTGVDLSFRNCTFSPETYYFGVARNLNYTKISNLNILESSSRLTLGSVYPLIGQTPIDRKDFNVFQSSWDPGYYNRFTSAKTNTPVAGTRSMKEFKSFLGSKMMKTPKNVIIDNYIVLQISPNSGTSDSGSINQEAFSNLVPIQNITVANSGTGIGVLEPYNTPLSLASLNEEIFKNVEVFWQKPTDTEIIGTIRLDRMLRRYLMNDGVGDVFFENIISEFGVGDPSSIQDDVITYLQENVIPIYEGSILQLYVKKIASGTNDIINTVRGDIASVDRSRQGFNPEKNVTFTKNGNLSYDFRFSIDPNFDYSLIFRFNIDKI